jgi:hypothetical protein
MVAATVEWPFLTRNVWSTGEALSRDTGMARLNRGSILVGMGAILVNALLGMLEHLFGF